MSVRRALLAAALVLPVLLPAQAVERKPVRLVLSITVDQLRGDYLDKFSRDFTGGFARLLREGVYYPNGRQDHAVTETAPGHSTIMSGRSPASTASSPTMSASPIRHHRSSARRRPARRPGVSGARRWPTG